MRKQVYLPKNNRKQSESEEVRPEEREVEQVKADVKQRLQINRVIKNQGFRNRSKGYGRSISSSNVSNERKVQLAQRVSTQKANNLVPGTRKDAVRKNLQAAGKSIANGSLRIVSAGRKAGAAIPTGVKLKLAGVLGGTVAVVLFFTVIFGALFSSEDGSSFAGSFMMPFDSSDTVSVTDDYGWRIHPVTGELSFHYGIDFGTPWHSEIKSIAIGEVIFAGDYDTYGNTVIIRHELYGDVIYSMYAHLSEIRVSVSQMVLKGEVIGLEGGDPDIDPNPGTSTGHHLHFAMMNEQMEYVNPNDYLPINK
ncbi:MAG: M23 family metallopeptidase [Anaerofustis sp.]